MDYAGFPCNWIELRRISNKHNIKLINDNCHAIGTTLNGNFKYAIKYADFVTLSFHPVKSITSGEGGAVVTNSKEKFDQRKLIFICGLPRSGTTLASQIVTAHSKVNSVGEISYLKNLIEDHFYENDSISFERIQSELKKKTNELNNLFFDVAQTFLQVKETKYIVDKTPSNCIWMGFIKLLFPNSYILYLNETVAVK